MTHIRTHSIIQAQVQRAVGSKDRVVVTNRTDRRTLVIALASRRKTIGTNTAAVT